MSRNVFLLSCRQLDHWCWRCTGPCSFGTDRSRRCNIFQLFHLLSSNFTTGASIFSSFRKVSDYITITNHYNVHNNTTPLPGSNAPPLSHGPSCPSAQDVLLTEPTMDQWTKASFSFQKILLPSPTYGYTVTSVARTLTETPNCRGKRSITIREHLSTCVVALVRDLSNTNEVLTVLTLGLVILSLKH